MFVVFSEGKVGNLALFESKNNLSLYSSQHFLISSISMGGYVCPERWIPGGALFKKNSPLASASGPSKSCMK